MAIGRKAPPLIAISMGDPAGIGAEIILKSAAVLARRRHAPSLVVIGDLKLMLETARRLKRVPTPRPWTPAAPPDPAGRGLSVLAASELPRLARRPGHPTVAGGEASFQYVLRGARMAMSGEVDALVTAPISKQGWHRAGHQYPGHSELVAEVGRTRSWRMMFAGAQLRLVLVTVHVGLREVSSKLTRGTVLETIRLLHRHLREGEGRSQPRIAVLGFNPHAGEQGLFGDEEIRAIHPAIKAARHSGIDAFGPLAPDTAFVRSNGRFNFDAVVAMYHDQGLIPLKTLEFDRAVNVTLGLPFIRTCPDHGTAFDIAGHGRANPASMIAAIRYASRAVDSRAAQRAA
ncbi:MAG: 4-hydroxythreonine-4-phosphate dehydrogenase PdxA [Deltaproteobacteria bacterium]|nr:4-hydroxythreonine-4-phosphate dehydrogenase PdxA [Deltaproteobacteria bacterium]